ncbi:MAG: LemA family protein, partial [Deltaproteobacteria bacterium]|nr:LemA family protein [Deltaproteobacteria bacterium]
MTKGQKTTLIVVGIVILVIAIPLLYLKGTYNTLVAMDEGVKGAWAQVENQLQRRYDLIPNYVETVKGYAAHEKEVFLKVTKARSKVGQAGPISDKIAANNELS